MAISETVTRNSKEAARRAAKAQFQSLLSRYLKDKQAAEFLTDMFDSMYDLIEASVKSGGIPKKGDLIKFFGARSAAIVKIATPEQQAACLGAVVDLGTDASKFEEGALGGAVGIAAYSAFVLYDLLQVGGECYLAYQDYASEAKVREFEKRLEAARTKRRLKQSSDSAISIDSALQMTKAHFENQCRMP